MNTLKLRRKSWHYWLASNLGGDYPESYAMKRKTQNICTYARAVFWNLLALLFFGVIGGVLIFGFIGLPILWLFTRNTSVLSIIEILWGWILVFGVIIGTTFLIQKYRKRSTAAKQPSFIGTWYRSIKEKVCYLVEFDEE